MLDKARLRKIGKVFAVILLSGGAVLTFLHNDAISMASKEKEGIVTAEQVNLAFQDIGGKLILENVKEAQRVKKGDVLMQLDTTDVDLSIASLEAQIKQSSGSIEIGLDKADLTEEQNYRSIEQSKRSLDAAKATYDNKELYFKRMQKLLSDGAISQLELDNAQMDLDVARADMLRAERALNELLAGTDSAERSRVMATGDAAGIYLPGVEDTRRELKNDLYNVESMKIELDQLKIQRERMTLKAPEDGKILSIIAKQGEMVSVNAPVILLESLRYYYDIYIDEKIAVKLHEGDIITGTAVATGDKVRGEIRILTPAPGFADLKMSREKGQADITTFKARIYTLPGEKIQPGMTVKVDCDELVKG